MSSSQLEDYNSGDVVCTAYGVGVLTAASPAASFRVRLWRMPGESIASSSVAILNYDAILRRLPAAPGLVTTMKGDAEKRVMVQCYYQSKNRFLVSYVNHDDGLQPKTALSPTSAEQDQKSWDSNNECFEVAPEELNDAPSAKFYPLLDELMRRGDTTAAATADFMRGEHVTSLMKKSAAIVGAVETTSPDDIISAETVSSSVKTVIPTEHDVKEIYKMLKDEELTVLLQKGRERLQQLVDKDVPEATVQALKKAGITIVSDKETSTFSGALDKSRQSALEAIEKLLADVDTADLQSIRNQLGDNFTTMFDSLSQVAKSDRDLSYIFDTISGKTFAWQEATGRLMATKSMGLFLEGASRLQARAANMLSMEHLQWAGEITTNLTKAFTERDAAVARLKSIELGDAVRSRLVDAIEVRSEAHGGLDGIIAGALTAMTQAGDASGTQIQDMLKTLQGKATSTSMDAHETLISVLSQRSKFRDAALLRLERVMCDLESELGEDMSPSELAALARGEGGTATLFQPIARRAAKEIEKQLNVAEASVQDPTILGALGNVRKIISGQLSIEGLFEEVIKLLDDDSVVAAGERFVKHGESVLDAIEGVSGNRVVGDVMEMAEKAGITKDSVMGQMERLNVNELLDTAGNAVSDEKARRELISSATDVALDFILRILPSMPVPPFDGVKDGLVYHLSNLSMKGFKVKKENILVEVAGMHATKKHATEPRSAGEVHSLQIDGASPNVTSSGDDVVMEIFVPEVTSGVKATELLIVDVKKISAVLDNVVWSFEQTYMPYLKGNGKADVKLSDGAIRLRFELRRKQRSLPPNNSGESPEDEWEPVLCLHDRSCSIGEVELSLQGESRLTWIFNKLASIFKGVLRDYVVRTVLGVIASKSGYILEQLNTNLSPYWPLIMRTAGLKLEDLEVAGLEDITASIPTEEDMLVELVWRESLPLGMNLLLNDDSGLLKIVDFPRGSQARSVCEQRQYDPESFKGATIVAVNGSRYETREQLFNALKDPGRPKSILFELAEREDAERIKRFVEGNTVSSRKSLSVEDREVNRENSFSIRTVTFTDEAPLGIEFAAALDGIGLVVSDFLPGEDGIVLAAERESRIQKGDLLTHINGELVIADERGKSLAVSMLESIGDQRPVSLSFTEYYLFQEIFEKPDNGVTDIGGPDELILVQKLLPDGSKRVAIDEFQEVSGVAEAGGILIGDHLVFINGVPVGAGCRFLGDTHSPELHEVYAMLREASSYPIGLTFARPKLAGRRWTATPAYRQIEVESAETHCVTPDDFEHIGCVFENKGHFDIVVTDQFAVPGPIQSRMQAYKDSSGNVHLSVESVNGQFVPSYASPDIVKNAMKRSWTANGRIELVLSDDTRKEWVRGLT